jgi:DNA primase
MIPIHDLQGRVVGFGGRTLTDEQPKYLNSPDTELFDKGKLLFGLDKARAAIAKQDQAVIVEGYFDVIALHHAGITNVVASMGTALSSAQVRQLLRYTESKRIMLNFDTDNAGKKAAERAVGEVETLAYRGDIQLRVLNIPDGKDPDDFLKNHPASDYQTLLDQAPLWLDWQMEQAIADKDLKQSAPFQSAVQAIVKLLGNLPNATLRTHYIHRYAERLSQGDSHLMLRLEEDLRLQVRGERWHGRSQKWQTKSDRNLLEEAEIQLLRLYLYAPEYQAAIVTALEERDLEFSLSHHRFLWRQIQDVEEMAAAAQEGSETAKAAIHALTTPCPLPLAPSPSLLTLIQDRCTDYPAEMMQLYSLFQLDEKTKRDILRVDLTIRAATAAMERIMCEKRCRHFQQLLADIDDSSAAELGQYYWQKIYSEKRRIADLDRERQVSFEDLVQAPWVGDGQ